MVTVSSVVFAVQRCLRSFCVPGVALALALSCLSAHAKDQVPDWVRQAAAQKTPTYSPRTDAVVLLRETAYSIAPDGTVSEHAREVVRILRPQGRHYGDMHAWYRGGEKLRYMHLWSVGADGTEYAVKDGDLQEGGGGASFELYSDYRARGGRPPAVDTGAVVAMEYEKLEHPFENDIIWYAAQDIPIVDQRLQLNLPPGYTYKAAWKGRQETQAIDLEQGRTLWEIKDASAIMLEGTPLAPSERALVPRLDVFYSGPGSPGVYGMLRGDWTDIGEWFETIAKDRNKPDPAITAKAQELVQGKTGFRERTEAIARFVQGDIRYVAIEIGIGGYQPHPATDTFRVRYGDCKDKATLLSAMLAAVGIRSTWVLVDTHRGVIAKDAPSVAANHMIAAIELPPDYKPEAMYSIVTAHSGKRFLIFDPTWEKTPFGHLERELQGSDALLIDGAQSQAIRLPVLAPQQNLVERKATFQLSPEGTLSGTVEEQQSGDIARARRMLYAHGTEREQQESLEHTLAHDFTSFQAKSVKVDGTQDLSQRMTVSYALTAEHFAQDAGTLLMVRPRVLGRDAFAVDMKPRKVPIDMHETREIRDEYTIALPPGYQVDELPAPVNVDLGFAAYRSESKVENQAIRYSRTYTVRDIMLPPDRYPDVQKLARMINADEESSAVLKRQN